MPTDKNKMKSLLHLTSILAIRTDGWNRFYFAFNDEKSNETFFDGHSATITVSIDKKENIVIEDDGTIVG